MILTVVLVGSLVVAAVLIHYEMLYRLASLVPEKAARHRYHVLVGVLGSFCAHVIEVWLFAFGYYFMISSGEFGTLQGNFINTLRDCSYFSFTTYSTLGVGDIEPVGHIRFLVGLESLTGLVLITWTASFVFVEMQKFWKGK
jgi:Ion channel